MIEPLIEFDRSRSISPEFAPCKILVWYRQFDVNTLNPQISGLMETPSIPYIDPYVIPINFRCSPCNITTHYIERMKWKNRVFRSSSLMFTGSFYFFLSSTVTVTGLCIYVANHVLLFWCGLDCR
jgi:hypothetical protein